MEQGMEQKHMTKQELLKLAKKEFATTLKVMHAFPEGKITFTPHERSQEAGRLMSTFIFEMYLCTSFVFGDALDRDKFKNYKPESLNSLIADFEKETTHIAERLEKITDAELSKTIEFGGAKFTTPEFILMMLCDQIHHRGQLTVYLRMAGGKIPSIYGPSADDQTTNL